MLEDSVVAHRFSIGDLEQKCATLEQDYATLEQNCATLEHNCATLEQEKASLISQIHQNRYQQQQQKY